MIPVSTHILTYQESVGMDVVKRLDTFTPKPSPDNPNPSPGKVCILNIPLIFSGSLYGQYMKHLHLV